MFRTIAFTAAVVVLSALPANPAAAGIAELLVEEHYSQDGYEVDLYVTKADDGIIAEATVTDPTTGYSIDFWSDGITIWWNGTIDGEPSEGSVPTPDVDGPGEPPQPICFTPVTAIICLGAILIATKTGCQNLESPCGGDRPTEVPGGAGGVPDDGGGGDGDSGDDGKSGGGDED